MGYVQIFLSALVWNDLHWSTISLLVQKQTVAQVEVKSATDREDDAREKLQGCLENKRIVFVGPSTSKFEYLATAYFAEYGRWPTEKEVYNAHGVPGPNPLNEHEVAEAVPGMNIPAVPKLGCLSTDHSWEAYYRYSNGLLNGHETCDCYRFGKWQGVGDHYNNTENRIYIKGNTMLAYFQWFGDTVLPRGTYDILPLLTQPYYAAQAQCPVGQFPGFWSWSMSIDRFLSLVVRYARPTHLVVSAAFWPVKTEDTVLWTAIAKAGVEAVMDTGGTVIWRNTPQRDDIKFHYQSPRIAPSIQAGMVSAGWKFWDTQSAVNAYKGTRQWSDIFYDNAHLQPPAASHLADAFLKTYVCPQLR